MKAAVIDQLGEVPKYKDFELPEIKNENQLLLNVKAAAVKNLDKARASGNHYASHKELPAVVGIDGVGLLEDGRRVYAKGITGMIAEKALIDKNKLTLIPDNLDFALAAALPNAVLGAAMALKVRGKIKPGQTVLINGATGVTGQMAVQIAKYYGAKKIITTGRNQENLEKTKTLGADQIVSLKEDDLSFVKTIREIHNESAIDLIIDYVWGKPLELILKALEGADSKISSHQTRIVSVGSMAGNSINLSSETLRSVAIEIVGSGLGSLSEEEFERYDQEILPEMFQLAAEGKLTMDVVEGKLENIENLWQEKIDSGSRLVIKMD